MTAPSQNLVITDQPQGWQVTGFGPLQTDGFRPARVTLKPRGEVKFAAQPNTEFALSYRFLQIKAGQHFEVRFNGQTIQLGTAQMDLQAREFRGFLHPDPGLNSLEFNVDQNDPRGLIFYNFYVGQVMLPPAQLFSGPWLLTACLSSLMILALFRFLSIKPLAKRTRDDRLIV